jgi:transposase
MPESMYRWKARASAWWMQVDGSFAGSKITGEPEALPAWCKGLGFDLAGIGSEAGPLSQMAVRRHEGSGAGGTRNAFEIMPVKTDRRDAGDIAQLIRMAGWGVATRLSNAHVSKAKAAPKGAFQSRAIGRPNNVEKSVSGRVRSLSVRGNRQPG